MSRLVLLCTLAAPTAGAFLSLYPRGHDFFFTDPTSDYWGLTTTASSCGTETYRTPTWSATNEAYTLKLVLPPSEPGSVSAMLTPTGEKVKIGFTRKIESCQCQPTTAREISLPYRPRPEDVSVAVDDFNVLTLKLARGPLDAKADATMIPLHVDTPKDAKGPETSTESTDQVKTRPLRFIPHESAKPSEVDMTVKDKERTVMDKFRTVAQATSAGLALAQQEGQAHSTEDPAVGDPAVKMGSEEPKPPEETANGVKGA